MRKLLIGTAILVSLVGSASARVSDDGKMYIMARPPSNQVGRHLEGRLLLVSPNTARRIMRGRGGE
jgi:hypothetical protein